ncbi:MAG: hypothetical protein KatS3mg103_0650 [Phycisphaerales bacterium]|nr:MAG: hypothetical protein KatS3mg103_0650 [Phycisphaerales bacterium]
MQGLFAKAQAARDQAGHGAIVRVSFNGSKMDLSEAQAKGRPDRPHPRRLRRRGPDHRPGHRAAGHPARGALNDLLAKLERERAQFQSELWRLNQQIDAIARTSA